MAKRLPTIWPIEPHTIAKHEILRRYISRWIPSLAKYNARMVYIDGFAGPGCYQGGEDGSPTLVLKRARDFLRKKTLRAKQFVMFLIEADADRYAHLKQELEELSEAEASYQDITVITLHNRYADVMDSVWSKLDAEKQRLAPTFAFIDPFGLIHTPFKHLQRFLASDKTEVFFNLIYEELNRFLTLPSMERHFDDLFGDETWRAIRNVKGAKNRRVAIIDYFKSRLFAAGAKYVLVFEMKNKVDATDYLLFFATKHIAGLRAMKEAMWQVDRTGKFSFSDYTFARGPMLIDDALDYAKLQAQILKKFRGRKSAGIGEVEEFVLAETSFFRFKKEALKALEVAKAFEATPPPGKGARRVGSYPRGTVLHFT